MKSAIAVIVAFFVLTCASMGTELQGDLTGTLLRANSPYQVIGNINVPRYAALIIEPGVVFDFQGYYEFVINQEATLTAIGNETDSIIFTCDTLVNINRWRGIRFDRSYYTSVLQYGRVEYSKDTGIECYYTHHKIANCTIRYNAGIGGEFDGGGIRCDYFATPIIIDNIITMNTAYNGGGICLNTYSAPIINNNIISNNTAEAGGGIFATGGENSEIINNQFDHNSARNGGGIYLSFQGIFLVESNVFLGNHADSGGGGLYSKRCVKITVDNNLLTDNHADSSGGAAYFDFCDSVRFFNNLVVENSAYLNGAIGIGPPCPVKMFNNTICNNIQTDQESSAIYCDSCRLVNNIIWNNGAHEIGGNAIVRYSDIQGGYPGDGNINTDPMFRDTVNSDYHLMSTACGDLYDSPCIDTGSRVVLDDALNCDRGLGTEASDMGAYGGGIYPRSYIEGDVNGSYSFNGLDVTYLVNYFRGGAPPLFSCECGSNPHFYATADVNGSCTVNGLDVTYMVGYFFDPHRFPPRSCDDCPATEY